MTRKPLIVIGAGIAGLSTGCYARMNGYDVQVFEKHDKPGGMCTSWVRKGYTFDYCIHNLIGSSGTAKAHRYWAELGALSGIEVLTFREMVQLEDQKGNRVDIVSDVDALERRLIERVPADADLVREYVSALRKLRKVEVMALMLDLRPLDQLSLLPKLGLFKKLGSITAAQFSDKFQDEFLRRSFRYVQYGIPEIPMIAHVGMFAAVISGDGGWPRGGSLTLSRNIEKRFPGLRGQVEAWDVITPVTTERYLGAYRGLQAWPSKVEMSTLMKEGLSTTLPGLEGFYMVGQYAQGTIGLTTVAAAGRKLVKRLCKEDGKKFQTSDAP
ncbi:MAG TPA: FAD-dependent oxidoreductase [Methanomassiliicoccales archaeon]|nr:FAD-dependent oxidoreductase [Methanomassiliicoccales archaeon]